jgi:hypothetical protein
VSDDVRLLGIAYGQITAVVTAPTIDLEAPTRLPAWNVCELLFHSLLDAQRVLIALATPTDDPADTDAVTYWQPSVADADFEGDAAHARYVQRAAAAYARPQGLVRHWSDTAAAAVRAARTAAPDGRIRTQRRVLTVPGFLSTAITEAAVHYLDLTVAIDSADCDPELLKHVRVVLDGLLGQPLPVTWSDREAVLKGTNRTRLDDGDKSSLGVHAADFPLLG